MDPEDIYSQVSERYGSAAKGSDAKYSDTVAKAFGYSQEELASVPKGANLGLSCGTPLVVATLKEVSCLSCQTKKKVKLTVITIGRNSHRSGMRRRVGRVLVS